MTPTHHRRRWAAGLGAVLALAAVPAVASAAPSDSGCTNRNFTTIDQLLACVDADDAFEHLAAFQSFADANGGTRASGTPGYDASADYVAETLAAVGFTIERQEFDYSLYTENSSSLSANGAAVPTQTMSYSGSGSITDGNVVAVDLDLGLGNGSTSGCEPEDFDGLDFSGPKDIALIQRGACTFGSKAVNAQAAGAEAVIIFNQGNAEGRFGIIGGTLGADVVGVLTIPVLDVAYDDGVALQTASMVNLSADTTIDTRTTENVIADLPGKNPDNVVMAGAHLDSVLAGPGIQDNGSGSAALLAIAEQLGENTKYVPQNTMRFAWWGAEESGLIGSEQYVFNPDFGLTDEEYFALALYLNFDMIASPNFIYGVYDADESSFEAPAPVPPGSAELEDLFEAYYSANGIPYEDTEFSGRSDYDAFISVGIPASGLFTGAEVVKTPEQEAIWGGIAGEQFDQCYHLACDTIDNVSVEALDVNIDAVAYAMFNVAASTELVNGVPGVKIPGPGPADVELDGPQGTFLDGGGGLDHAHDHGPGITS
jgi:Zn-dependent M28 family amino/carboxypeptidase